MKKILFCLLISLGFSACSLNPDTEKNVCGVASYVTFSGFPLNCNYTVKNIPTNPTAIVVNTQEKMDSFFTKHDNTCPTPVSPTIDFAVSKLVGIFAGSKPTSGYAIKMATVVENNCEIVINFYEKAPLPNEVVTQGTTYPSDFILIPKTDKPIYFNKVNPSADNIVVGTFFGQCSGSDCLNFYQMNEFNVLRFLNVGYGSYDFSKYGYKALAKRGEYSLFLSKIPVEILNLKGQTKTYGSPDSHDQGGVYFELRQGIYTTKIFLDNDNTPDQNPEMLLFKKAIQDKITALKAN
jgi:hypothetical protein